jgi:hypothetical protein
VGSYKVEEIYWIHKSGLLIFQVASDGIRHRNDRDIISGFLTGIIDFTKDAFFDDDSSKNQEGIKEIQMGEKDVLVENGRYTYLVTVFSGRPGKRLYHRSNNTLKKLETKYQKELPSWDGNIDELDDATIILRSILPIANRSNLHNYLSRFHLKWN